MTIKFRKFGMEFIIDDEVYHLLKKHKYHLNQRGRLSRNVGRQKTNIENDILGKGPDGYFIDHINFNLRDIRCSNLRYLSPAESSRNRPLRKGSKTGFMGVTERKRRNKVRYEARFQIQGHQYHIGVFDNPKVAAFVRDVYVTILDKNISPTNCSLGLLERNTFGNGNN